jgi:hypothetical protein
LDEELESKILRKVFLWMVAGGITVGGVSGSGVLRVGKFTQEDAAILEQQLRFECRQMEQQIRKDMPPENTRKRIRAIERYLERTSDFETKEYHW